MQLQASDSQVVQNSKFYASSTYNRIQEYSTLIGQCNCSEYFQMDISAWVSEILVMKNKLMSYLTADLVKKYIRLSEIYVIEIHEFLQYIHYFYHHYFQFAFYWLHNYIKYFYFQYITVLKLGYEQQLEILRKYE